MDMTDTIVPKSDQLNAEDLLTGPRTVTITEVRKGNPEQPVAVHLDGLPGRPYYPCKSMRRVMVAAWGADASAYVGRRMRIYRDPAVRFGGMDVGGIRIESLSHLDKPMTLALTVTRGKRAPYVIKPLADDAPTEPVPTYMADARAARTIDEWRQVWQRAKDAGHLTDALKAELIPIGEALKAPAAEETTEAATPAARMMTDSQSKALHASLSADFGITERADKLAFLSSELGREIGSSKDLTADEASGLLDEWTAARNAKAGDQ